MFNKKSIIITLITFLVVLTISGNFPYYNPNQTSNLLNKKELSFNETDKYGIETHFISEKLTQLEEHEPIIIDNNEELITQATNEGWHGNGSKFNPFNIRWLRINSGSFSIRIEAVDLYFVIQSCELTNAESYGILFYDVSNGVISNNIITNCDTGIKLIGSENITIGGNNLEDNEEYGIVEEDSRNSIIGHNYVSNSLEFGIKITNSPNNVVMQNELHYCSFYFGSTDISNNFQSDVFDNSVNGKPLVFLQNITGWSITNPAGQVVVLNCTFVSISNLNISECSNAILVADSDQISIYNNELSNNIGISLILRDSNNCTVYKNNFTNNSDNAIDLYKSNENLFHNNTISKNRANGIHLSDSRYNQFFNNTISNNRYKGIFLWYASLNTLTNNLFSYNDHYGVALHYSSGNTINKNDFIKNSPDEPSQAYEYSPSFGLNYFEYNFWSDLTKPDNDNDGIVDKSYDIHGETNNKDPYPVTKSYYGIEIKSNDISGFSLLSTLSLLLIFSFLKKKIYR